MRTRETYFRAALLLTTILMFGCDEAPAPSEPVMLAPSAAAKGLPEPSDAVISMLDEAIQQEYYLAAMYVQLADDFASFNVAKSFTRIAAAEDRHVAALGRQYDKYELEVPASSAEAPVFETLSEACTAAVAAEAATVDMYGSFIAAGGLPERIASVFESLMEASGNHLNALTRCR